MRHFVFLCSMLALISCGKEGPKNKNGGGDGGDSPPECIVDVEQKTWSCTLTGQTDPAYADQIGCIEDFDMVAADPLDASIPGARSAKTLIDLWDDNRLYIMNSNRWPIHEMFVDDNLVGPGMLPKPEPFINEYTSPDRRFILGALTYYEEPDVWAYEIAPYDTADEEMNEIAYRQIRDNTFFGDKLRFHPTSEAQEPIADNLAEDICVIGTDELFDGITYQPLNLGEATGLLTFRTAEEVDGVPIYFREIPVLDAVPNDIGITAAIITDAFQTPLSHINVLAQNRGSPNMALIGAWEDPELRKYEGKWVRLSVGAFEYSIEEISAEEAEDWWQNNKPEPLESFPPDLTVAEMMDIEQILDLTETDAPLGDQITQMIPAFGGKATHFSGIAQIGPECPTPDAFAIPIYYYWDFMAQNGFRDRLEGWMDPLHPNYASAESVSFRDDPQARQDLLHQLQADMLEAPLTAEFVDDVTAKLSEPQYQGVRMRFRSSTNAEDLGAFTGAGLYTSFSGYLDDPTGNEPFETAVKTVWGSVWNPRAWDEREYYSIDHLNVGMSLLSHPSFPDEEVNGVAITNNIFDPSGLEPAFYVNVQMDNWSVVLPEFGVTSDQVLYYFDRAGQPIVYIGSSNLIPDGYTVMDAEQMYQLGTALKAIHELFFPVYGDRSFYAMDTEFKFDDSFDTDGKRHLFMKQARPYPGRGDPLAR